VLAVAVVLVLSAVITQLVDLVALAAMEQHLLYLALALLMLVAVAVEVILQVVVLAVQVAVVLAV
jgi:hypothetical protein